MIKVYVYPTSDSRSKDIVIKDEQYFQFVSEPDEADWLYTPVDLGLVWWDSKAAHGDPKGGEFVRDFVYSLPYYQGNEQRHFFHDYSACSDDWGLRSVLFRAVKSRHDPNPFTVSVPHTVEDFKPDSVDFSTLPYDVCFVGRWIACPVRKVACEAVRGDKSIKSHMIFRESFWGYVERDDPKQAAKERMEFVNAMRMSKLVLSPRGVELDAYRTWEGMSASRPTIWIGDDYELPFEEFVDYGDFMFHYPESDAPIMNRRVKEILQTHTDEQLRAHGERARRAWLEWFSAEARCKTFAHYLRKFR